MVRRFRRGLGRSVLGGVAALAIVVTGAAPAGAKGPASLTITGPGLDDPIEVSLTGEGADAPPPYVVVALMELVGPYDLASRADARDAKPGGRLHERYTLTWTMAHPPDADPASYTVVQDVYPNAAFGGPFLADADGWYEARPALRDTLAALGVPVTHPTTAHLAATQAATPPAPPRPGPDRLTPWPLALAGAAGLTAGLTAGVTLARRRPTP